MKEIPKLRTKEIPELRHKENPIVNVKPVHELAKRMKKSALNKSTCTDKMNEPVKETLEKRKLELF